MRVHGHRALSALCKSVGPICARAFSRAERKKERERRNEKLHDGTEEGTARAAAGIKSSAATATAAINTHLFRSVLYTREAWAHEPVR